MAFILSEGWKAASSTCKADSRAFKKAELPVCPLEAFREPVSHLLGQAPSMLCWRRKDPRVTYKDTTSKVEWRVRLTDLEWLADFFQFVKAKADASVGTARAPKMNNYNSIVELELVHRRKREPKTWARRDWLEVRIWVASMSRRGAVSLPAGRYSEEDAKEIELFLRTLTMQAKDASKPVDSVRHCSLRRLAKQALA